MIPKLIRICDLPNGYFKERLSSLVVDANTAQVWVVAKEGMASDWVAYIGFPSMSEIKPEFQESENLKYNTSNIRTMDAVLRLGDKLSRDEAAAIFPELANNARLVYRR